MKVAAVILNYNSSKDSILCAQCLSKQQGVDMQIIVVDNNSDAADREILEAYCRAHELRWMKSSENKGYNAGNNIGLREADAMQCDYALIVNPDMIIKDVNYVSTLIKEIQLRPQTVVVCSDIVSPRGTHQNPMKEEGSWIHCFDWFKGFFRKKQLDAYEYVDDYTTGHPCHKVCGCCFLIDMKFLKQIGYFDEHVFLYCEEAILSKQVEQQGKSMFYTTAVQALHNHLSGHKGNASKRFASLRHSRIYFIRRYSGYPFWGKWIAILAITLYTGLMQWVSKR